MTPTGSPWLKPLGLDHGINYATDSFVEHTNQLTDSRGVDIVIDSIGGQNLVDSVDILAYRATLVSIGVAARAGSAIEARSLWTRNNTLRGVFLGGAILPDYARIHPMIGDMLQRVASGELHVEDHDADQPALAVEEHRTRRVALRR
jgi:NADPH:quinone reductase-like Zn-dependent oxidoreductase